MSTYRTRYGPVFDLNFRKSPQIYLVRMFGFFFLDVRYDASPAQTTSIMVVTINHIT